MTAGAPPGTAPIRYGTPPGRWILVTTVLGSGMAAIDATVVGIALPSIGRELHASFGTLQWVVDAYTLTLAALLLFGGALGDRFGRKRIFLVGVVWFTLASVACALAPGSVVLVVMRALQGAGAALLTPTSLAILQASFLDADRSRAVGAWSGLSGVATAAGPLLGGYLLAVASWRWIFVINVPIGALVLVVAARHVPERADATSPTPLDVPGAVLAVLALLGVTFALIEGPTRGWSDPVVVAALLAGLASIAALVVAERRSATPMAPPGLLSVRRFTVTNAVTFVVYGALSGVLFLLPILLQVHDGYSALAAGVALLPLTVIMLALSSSSGRLAARIGPRLQLTAGPLVIGLGLVLLGRSATESGYATGVLPGVVVLGLGLAVTVAPLTATALGALPDARAGLAAAVNSDVARLGGLVAVAVLPAVAGLTGDVALEPAALASGFRTAVLVAGACCVVASVMAAVGLRGTAPVSKPLEEVEAGHCFHCALDAAPLVTRTVDAAAR